MQQNDTWLRLLGLAVLLGADTEDAKEQVRFITLRKVVAYAVIGPLLVCALLITVALWAFMVLAVKLSSGSIGLLETASTAFWCGRRKT